MNLGIQKDITTLARKCLKAAIPIRIACEKLCKAMQDEMFRTLIEAPGLVRAEKKE